MIISQLPCGSSGNTRFDYTGHYREIVDSETGNWELHLLSSGTLKLKRNTQVDVFAVGGGGAGGSSASSAANRTGETTYYRRGGGGGAGGYTVTQSNIYLSAYEPYTVEIGAGGVAEDNEHANGNPSRVLDSGDNVIVIALGGGAAPANYRGGNGGCGGGSGGCVGLEAVDGGSGGENGGNGGNRGGISDSTGQGTTTRAFGTGELYAGGGGGGGGRIETDGPTFSSTLRGKGGNGGGGDGGSVRNEGNDGEPNTGGGGGGGGSDLGVVGYTSSFPGGNGGSGIVIIRNARA